MINDSNLASSSNIIREHSLSEQKSLCVGMIGQEQRPSPAASSEMKGATLTSLPTVCQVPLVTHPDHVLVHQPCLCALLGERTTHKMNLGIHKGGHFNSIAPPSRDLAGRQRAAAAPDRKALVSIRLALR